jgi:23S rRNA pseudouridine1911/1915/1917 synthase
MPLDIIFEDEHLLVINKPAGLTVHPSDSSNEPTLVHGLLAHCGASLSGIGGIARPGIVHRIDKDTTGLLVVAKHDQAHQHLSAQLKSRTLSRHYMALCWGVPKPANGTIQTFIGRSPRDRKKMAVLSCGGREAITHYTLEEKFRASETQEIVYFASRIGCKLETGRTHQIRVHLAHIGNPLIGDTLYGANGVRKMAGLEISDAIRTALTSFQRQALHAQSIRFIHPKTAEVMQFETPLPTDLSTLINLLR